MSDGARTALGWCDLSAHGGFFADLASACDPSIGFQALEYPFASGDLETGGPLILVGHGTGAYHALHAAARLGERVERLVLLDGPPTFNRASPYLETAVGLDPGARRVGATWAHRDGALSEGIASGRLPRSGMSRNLRRAVEAETVGSGFAWRPSLTEDVLVERIRTLPDLPAALGDGIEVTLFRARSGHRPGEPPLEIAWRCEDVRTLDCTHAGMLWDPLALHPIAATISAAH